jgi:hypothetical protein
MSEHERTHEWESGWHGHHSAQARRLASLSLADKIAWLEEAQKVADSLGRSAQGGGPVHDERPRRP